MRRYQNSVEHIHKEIEKKEQCSYYGFTMITFILKKDINEKISTNQDTD